MYTGCNTIHEPTIRTRIAYIFLTSSFTGYKLSLDNLGVAKHDLAQHGPKHTLPSADMYSFLHAKAG